MNTDFRCSCHPIIVKSDYKPKYVAMTDLRHHNLSSEEKFAFLLIKGTPQLYYGALLN